MRIAIKNRFVCNMVIILRHHTDVLQNRTRIIMWTTPAATEMRFGFEVTMYVMNK
ncbi:MAG: coenzyme PQQ precursor peptide PqqA [Methylophilaceae bacterium]|jgi:coenzyme PQQ precursor peptide PqqA